MALDWGYTAINGAATLEQGALGEDTVVAIIDGGVSNYNRAPDGSDPTDFNDRIDGRSTDVQGGTTVRGTDGLDRENSHASAIASVIASARDGRGRVGLVPETTILSIDADKTCGTGCFTQEDIAAAIVHAGRAGADVINMSLGGEVYSQPVLDALIYATERGSIAVAAAGNTGASLTYPAKFAYYERIGGRMIAVGSVRSDLQISSFSARPSSMAQAERFMVTPGERVKTANQYGDIITASGTSVAAPYVTGTIAAIRSAHPFLAPEEVVEIVLTTARDLGEPGTDLVYGRGLLDVQRALQPVGGLSLPGGPSLAGGDEFDAELSSSELVLGAAFGDALAGASVIGDAIALDSYGRAFDAALDARIAQAKPISMLERRVTRPEQSSSSGQARMLGGRLGWSADNAAIETGMAALAESKTGEGGLHWRSKQTPLGVFRLGLDVEPGHGIEHDGPAAELAMPELGLVGSGNMLGLAGEGFSVSLREGETAPASGQSLSGQSSSGQSSSGQSFLSTVQIEPADGVTLRHSLLVEDGAGLGSKASGAFAGLGDGAVSQFLGFGLLEEVGGWRLGLDATLGATRMSTHDARFDGWSTVWSTAFAAHARKDGLLVEDDAFTALVGQPLRVESGSVTATLPVSQRTDGTLIHRSGRLNATPSGREIRLELTYERPLGEHMRIAPWAILRHQPNHDAHANDEAIIGITGSVHW